MLQEIDREVPTGDVTVEHLARMPYVEACVKETLRLYTPAPVLARQLAEDTVIQGRSFPKGTGVMVRIHSLPFSSTKLTQTKNDRLYQFGLLCVYHLNS